MNQAREAAGLDREDVQFTLTMSPVWYLFFSPRISGPSESGKSAKPNTEKTCFNLFDSTALIM